MCCCCYHKGTYFQANHNKKGIYKVVTIVVVATTKVRIFKQITTMQPKRCLNSLLLLLPQRYVFSSKSQQGMSYALLVCSCCCYHKGTYFQANHNAKNYYHCSLPVVVATTKVRIFKQITTDKKRVARTSMLLLLPQRYVFSSKSQPIKI